MPAGRELRGAAGMQLGGVTGRNSIEQDGRDARTPGGREARLVASLRSSGTARVWPHVAGVLAGLELRGDAAWRL